MDWAEERESADLAIRGRPPNHPKAQQADDDKGDNRRFRHRHRIPVDLKRHVVAVLGRNIPHRAEEVLVEAVANGLSRARAAGDSESAQRTSILPPSGV